MRNFTTLNFNSVHLAISSNRKQKTRQKERSLKFQRMEDYAQEIGFESFSYVISKV